MPNLTVVTESARILQTIKALSFYLAGSTKVDACVKAGITTDIFDQWIGEARDVLSQYQGNFLEVQKARLLQIASAEGRLLDRLVTVALLENNPNKIVRALEYLGRMRRDLESKLGATVEHSDADDYLEQMTGPATRIEASKMSEIGASTHLNVRPRPDGSLDISFPQPLDILDLQAFAADQADEEEED